MADTKISADAAVGTLDGTEIVPVVSGGANGRTTTQAIADLGSASIAPLVLEDANTVAQRNGVNAQTFKHYKTFTSATNYEGLKVGWSSDYSAYVILSDKGSAGGTIRDLIIGPNNLDYNSAASVAIQGGSTGKVSFAAAGCYVSFGDTEVTASPGWGVASNANGGHFVPNTNNSMNIGTDATRVKTANLYTLSLKPVAVASLPGSPSAGMIAAVNDATAPSVGATVSAGGAAYAMVQYNGSAWKVLGV